ncbi:hypothetical protein D9V41_14945 [Aeromicrobium phragmitis]|uniref:Uncharacterized protein n=1 Tax=Aeromicrobium phragmitis TaxID=2478914 RepID=A0A3L8PL06_9ACTN|nr:hypothetical protein [Aeromicrobium phragmitis]RLV54742.1 hypothetical protein D9V41_14945 [Aeromicrobium phragmitis]
MLWSFTGQIAGLGTTSGVRIVVGRWLSSPFGAFSDVMLETSAGRRTLLAPGDDVADFVSTTYRFDDVVVGAVTVDADAGRWRVAAPEFDLDLTVGRRTPLGHLLRLVPGAVRDRRLWARALDPVARIVQPGVRTHGSAGAGRIEWYAARDLHAIIAARGTFRGQPLGVLAPVVPPVHVGFGSAPRAPSLTTLRSFVQVRD